MLILVVIFVFSFFVLFGGVILVFSFFVGFRLSFFFFRGNECLGSCCRISFIDGKGWVIVNWVLGILK